MDFYRQNIIFVPYNFSISAPLNQVADFLQNVSPCFSTKWVGGIGNVPWSIFDNFGCRKSPQLCTKWSFRILWVHCSCHTKFIHHMYRLECQQRYIIRANRKMVFLYDIYGNPTIEGITIGIRRHMHGNKNYWWRDLQHDSGHWTMPSTNFAKTF